MPRLSLWKPTKTADYHFIDRHISEWFGISGTAAYIHKYLGPYDQSGDNAQLDETHIQDVLFLENRDRRYSKEVFELRTVYSVSDNDFDMKQFGLFLTADTLFLEFHLNDMLAMIGRKLMPGDVIELPHLRDDALLDPEAKAVNKYYVVDDANRASDGYSPTWLPHIWRVRVTPMTDAQEYRDILDKQALDPYGFEQGRLQDLISTIGIQMGINEAVVEEARRHVPERNYETRHFYVIPGDELSGQYPWVFAGDGDPPNGAIPIGAGASWPQSPNEGDYFLRTDYEPKALFRWSNGAWRLQEVDYRKGDWMAAHRMLVNFINNTKTHTLSDGTVINEKQPLSQTIKPRADF